MQKTYLLKKTKYLCAAILLPALITGCPLAPPNPPPPTPVNTLSVFLESNSYGPNGEYFTSNNDGSLMIDRPFAPPTSEGNTAWINAIYSNTNGVCRNFNLGNSISGVSSDYFSSSLATVEINSSGRIVLPYITTNPHSRIDFLACNDFGATTSHLPEIPFPEERAFNVTYDYPFFDEVTLDYPYVLRGDDLALSDEEALLAISIFSDSIDDVCYYYGFGPFIEYTTDATEWDITSVLGVRDGFSGMLVDFDTDYVGNEGFASITCELPTKENASKVAEKLNPKAQGNVQTREILAKRAQENKANNKIKDGGKKETRPTPAPRPKVGNRKTTPEKGDSKYKTLTEPLKREIETPEEPEESSNK